MNATVTDSIRSAICAASPKQWEKFFETARRLEYNTLVGTPDLELTNVKYRVMMINELEELFRSARQSTTTHEEDES